MMEVCRIILVDDDEALLQLLVAGLQGWATERCCEIVPCHSAAEALVELEREAAPVAIVLSDQQMPGMKGSELLLIVGERYPDVITMLFTGHADLRRIADAVQAGIFSFIVKPCTPDYLRGELDKALKVRNLHRENAHFISTMQEEMRWGGELQRALLKLDLPSSQRVRFAASSTPLPLFHCGGDYHDVVVAPGGETFFMIGDVAGHGVRAAFLTFFLRAAIRQGYLAKAQKPSPAGLLEWLNRLVCDELDALPDMLITFSVCMLSDSSPALSYANAGHLALFLVREGTAVAFNAEGAALGFDRESAYLEESREVRPGDFVVLRTDGLRELGRDLLVTEDDFGRMLTNAAQAEDYNGAVLESVRTAVGDAPFTDDATLLTAFIL
jgi:phosphoserine phosphatase RsbU/P